MEDLRTICLKNNLYLFSDEAYREFCYSGEYISALHLNGMDEHVVLMDTISKRYSACGARLGAFVTRNKAVYDAAMKFAQARLSPPGLAQIMGEAAVDLPHHRRRHLMTQVALSNRLMVTGPHPDWRSRAVLVDHYGTYLAELVTAGGSAFAHLLGAHWFHDRFEPTFVALIELKQRIPLEAIARGEQPPRRAAP